MISENMKFMSEAIKDMNLDFLIKIYKNGPNRRGFSGRVEEYPVYFREDEGFTDISITSPTDEEYRTFVNLPTEPVYDANLLKWTIEEAVTDYINVQRQWNQR